MLTGKKPNLSRMRVFGSVCYTYKHDKKKLDSRCEKGVFIGYDKYRPAYLVYYPVLKVEIALRLEQDVKTRRRTQEVDSWVK